jgi:trimethylamine--corrinoid protein Co-methyltransferase
MQTAEILACNVMNWLLLGRVIGYGGGATILDMKHTTPSQSGPEVTLLFLACMELQRYYGLAEPMFPYALNADAKIPDVQAGIEKAITATLAVVAGSRLLSAGLGCLFLSGVASLPQIAIDYELCQFLDHMAKGIVVNDTTIALDVIKSVGIGGSFLGEQHTVRHFREVMFFSDLFDRRTPGQWQTDCQGMLNLAKQKVKGMLERDNPPPYLTDDQTKELTRIVAHAGAQLSHHR